MFAVTETPIDAHRVEASVLAPGYGGVVTFLGFVRERSDDDRAVDGLAYEAHESMAVAEFEKIAAALRERYGDLRVAIVHRTGSLNVGEVAVVVAVAAPHRRVAFAACAEAIDELKKGAPIWKKERYLDGTDDWRENAP